MTPYVILPDGRLELDLMHFILPGVDLEPIEFPIVSARPDIQHRYVDLRLAGESHSFAEILATRSFPGIKTDAVFNEGKFSGQSTGECRPHGTWLRQQAEAAGVSTSGKWYCSGLASFPGDPTAWVDSRGDVLRIAREKNMTVKGYVEHQGYEVDPGEDIDIAEDIIEDGVQDALRMDPGAKAEEVRDYLTQLRSGAIDPNPLVLSDSNPE